MTSSLTLAIDQGTSSTKALVVDGRGVVVAQHSVAIGQSHPQPGWVEQDPHEILGSVRAAASAATASLGPIAAIGLSSQRESALAWDRRTGEPLGPMLGWQDRRTRDRALALSAQADRIRQITGLPLDPMFSALKFAWLLDAVDPDRSRSRRGEIALGTVDSWLVFALTGEHRIETGNASRTQLLDLTGHWSPELADLFDIPMACLPPVCASDEPTAAAFDGVPVGAILGDSHAALYGHGVRSPGTLKVTYGTGSSIMGLSDGDPPAGLVGTLAWQLQGAAPQRAIEGNILATGATMAWLSRLVGVPVAELVERARTVGDDHGVTVVPAVAGLGAPTWDAAARAVIHGFDLGTDAAVLARAVMESIVHQVEDVIAAAEAGGPVAEIRADGAPARDDVLLQLQANVSGRRVLRTSSSDLSALGVAELAAQSVGVDLIRDDAVTTFSPDPTFDVGAARTRWAHAVDLARTPTNEREQ